MDEIRLSVCDHGPDAVRIMQTLLQQFEQEQGIQVQMEVIPWASGWSRMVEAALYHSGPDVSEIGSTWAGDLARMEALRPFSQAEIEEIIGEERYFESVWESVAETKDESARSFSIPWSADVRVVFYRRDLFAKAGVDEAIAFLDAAHFDQTLAALQAKRIAMPLALPTRLSNLTIHNVAAWVWGAGGQFLTPDESRPAFDQPQALEGFKTYFRLSRYLNGEARNLLETETDEMFWSGRAAVILSGYWILHIATMTKEMKTNFGVKPVPGVPFVGGNHLVVWKHCRRDETALRLTKFLESKAASSLIFPQFGLPVRPSSWTVSPFDGVHYQTLMRALQSGRGFPVGQLWGLVEKRLTDTLGDIWAEVLNEPTSHLDVIVETRLKDLAHRLQLTLQT